MLRILGSCCGVADYSGTHLTGEEILRRYCEQKEDKTKHTYVIFTFTNNSKKNFKEFVKIVRSNKLGTLVYTGFNHNIRYRPKGNLINVVTFRPDYEKLEEWYKQGN